MTISRKKGRVLPGNLGRRAKIKKRGWGDLRLGTTVFDGNGVLIYLCSAPGAQLGSVSEKTGKRALQTLRMVGTGFTLRESVDEAQAVTTQDISLKVKVFPGLLLSLLDRDKGKTDQAPTLLRLIGQWLEHPEMPAPIAALHNLSLAVAGGRAASILVAAENVESILSHITSPVPEAWYQHLLAPADPAKPLNSDLNALYRKRLEEGHDQALLEWMQAYSRSHQALAL